MRAISLVALALSLTLAGCSGSDSDSGSDTRYDNMMDNGLSAPVTNSVDMSTPDNATMAPPPVAVPSPTPTPTPVIAPPKDFGDPEQLQLDAESAGMTARVNRGAPPKPAVTDTPVMPQPKGPPPASLTAPMSNLSAD